MNGDLIWYFSSKCFCVVRHIGITMLDSQWQRTGFAGVIDSNTTILDVFGNCPMNGNHNGNITTLSTMRFLEFYDQQAFKFSRHWYLPSQIIILYQHFLKRFWWVHFATQSNGAPMCFQRRSLGGGLAGPHSMWCITRLAPSQHGCKLVPGLSLTNGDMHALLHV